MSYFFHYATLSTPPPPVTGQKALHGDGGLAILRGAEWQKITKYLVNKYFRYQLIVQRSAKKYFSPGWRSPYLIKLSLPTAVTI